MRDEFSTYLLLCLVFIYKYFCPKVINSTIANLREISWPENPCKSLDLLLPLPVISSSHYFSDNRTGIDTKLFHISNGNDKRKAIHLLKQFSALQENRSWQEISLWVDESERNRGGTVRFVPFQENSRNVNMTWQSSCDSRPMNNIPFRLENRMSNWGLVLKKCILPIVPFLIYKYLYFSALYSYHNDVKQNIVE